MPFGEHLVGEPGPAFPGLVRLSGGDRQDVHAILFELVADLCRVQRTDVGIRDDGVPMSRDELASNGAGLGQESRCNPDRARAKPDLARRYQVTSPAPVRTFATRASMKRRSDNLFR